jgi:hypothetical protein
MSYTRWNGRADGSYVVGTSPDPTKPRIECMSCRMTPDGKGWYKTVILHSATAMYEHLKAHRRAGLFVPRAALKRLREEAEKENL